MNEYVYIISSIIINIIYYSKTYFSSSGKLSPEAIMTVLGVLQKTGNAEPLDKTRTRYTDTNNIWCTAQWPVIHACTFKLLEWNCDNFLKYKLVNREQLAVIHSGPVLLVGSRFIHFFPCFIYGIRVYDVSLCYFMVGKFDENKIRNNLFQNSDVTSHALTFRRFNTYTGYCLDF